MRILNRGWLAMLLAGMWFCAQPVSAGEDGSLMRRLERNFASEAAPVRKRREFRGGISLDEAVNRVRESTRGRILSAEDLDSEYRVRLLTPDGVVRRLRIDPGTGRILR